MSDLLDKSHTFFQVFEREGKTAYWVCNSNRRNSRVRGFSVARVLTEITIKREQMVSNFFQKMWDNPLYPILPISTSKPDRRITKNLLTNQCELNSATVSGNTDT